MYWFETLQQIHADPLSLVRIRNGEVIPENN
jgi:hypothetical protein